jgi:hypothetical protein
VLSQLARHVYALVKAALGPMGDQHRLALTNHGVFHRAKGGHHCLAAVDKTCSGGSQVMRILGVDADGGNNQDC